MPYLNRLKESLGSPKAITAYLDSLNVNSMKVLQYQIEAEHFWARRNVAFASTDRKARAQLSWVSRLIKKRFASSRVAPERTASGAILERSYTNIDGPVRFAQIMLNSSFDCLQADAYSAHWYNAEALEIVEYCEGDVYRTCCENRLQYQEEMMRALNFISDQAA